LASRKQKYLSLAMAEWEVSMVAAEVKEVKVAGVKGEEEAAGWQQCTECLMNVVDMHL